MVADFVHTEDGECDGYSGEPKREKLTARQILVGLTRFIAICVLLLVAIVTLTVIAYSVFRAGLDVSPNFITGLLTGDFGSLSISFARALVHELQSVLVIESVVLMGLGALFLLHFSEYAVLGRYGYNPGVVRATLKYTQENRLKQTHLGTALVLIGLLLFITIIASYS